MRNRHKGTPQTLWEYFKRFFTYGGITNDFKEEIRKIKLEMEANK